MELLCNSMKCAMIPWWNWVKLKIVDNDKGENVYPFVFILSFVVCVYLEYLFDVVRNQT